MFSANASPNITVDAVFNVTVGQLGILHVSTFDQDGDNVEVTLKTEVPEGATFENNVFTWTPKNMNPMNITYVLEYYIIYHACVLTHLFLLMFD